MKEYFRDAHRKVGDRLVMNTALWLKDTHEILDALEVEVTSSLICEVTKALHCANAHVTDIGPDALREEHNNFVNLIDKMPDDMKSEYLRLREYQDKYIGVGYNLESPSITGIGRDAMELLQLRNKVKKLEHLAMHAAVATLGAALNPKRPHPRRDDPLPGFEAPDTLEQLFGKRKPDMN